MRKARWIAMVSGAVLISVAAAGSTVEKKPAASAPRSVTVPFVIDHNRMIVDVEFIRADGTIRAARAWVDTGNQFLMLGEKLARDLGVEIAPPAQGSAHDEKVWAIQTPRLRLRGMPLEVAGIRTQILGGERLMPGVPAEANLPASALRHDYVVFDYPKRRLTIARPGVLKPQGVAIPCRINNETGLFQIEATADGDVVQLAVDNGSSYTWVSDTLTAAWLARHPDWPHTRGAVGAANFFGFGFEANGTLMRLPELRFGGLRAQGAGLLGLPQALFDWYSEKTAGPVAGFIGANVLQGFRLEVDYPSAMTYWKAGPPPAVTDLDVVGLTLRPEPDGGFSVAGVATRDGKPAVEGIQPDDRLVQAGPLDTAGATMGAVSDALRGKPGDRRSIVVEREGKRIPIEANVMRFP